jgi:hypothetical protein
MEDIIPLQEVWFFDIRNTVPGLNSPQFFCRQALLFFWIMASISFSGMIDVNPALKLAALHLDLLIIGFLAFSFFADLSHQHLWGLDIRPHRRQIFGSFAGFVLLAAVSGWLGAGQIRAA